MSVAIGMDTVIEFYSDTGALVKRMRVFFDGYDSVAERLAVFAKHVDAYRRSIERTSGVKIVNIKCDLAI